jgi:AcrR family transcriptional regulator
MTLAGPGVDEGITGSRVTLLEGLRMDRTENSTVALRPWKSFRVRQRDGDVKRAAVLETAAHLFMERGYRSTSLRELASLLKITKPALYYYFQNKEQILVECYRAGIASIEGLLGEAELNDGNGLERVEVYLRVYATAIVSHDFGRCVAMLDDYELSPAARREVRALKRRIDASIRGCIEEGIEDGSITDCDPKLAAFAAAGAINWIGTWYRPDGGLSREAIATGFAQLLTRGLARRNDAVRNGARKTPAKRISKQP